MPDTILAVFRLDAERSLCSFGGARNDHYTNHRGHGSEDFVLRDIELADNFVETEVYVLNPRFPESLNHEPGLIGLLQRDRFEHDFRDAKIVRNTAGAAEKLL